MRTRTLIFMVAAVLVAICTIHAGAAIVQYTVDPTQSSLSIVDGTVYVSVLGSAPITEQAAGSLTASYSGMIDADVTTSTIQILSTTNLIAGNTFARLEEALERQVRFTADASHELRTPIAAILADCQFSLKKERPAERYRETIEVCHESAQHMRSLIADLGLLAQFDAGTQPLEMGDHDLRDILCAAAEISRPLAENHGITLQVELPDDPLPVRADKRRLTQALINLLGNAVRYNRPNGTVTLKSWRDNGRALIEVADTGVGIDTKHLDKIFDRFYRVDKSRNLDSGGSGLGLSISQNIIHGHHGEITGASEPGVGTTFQVILPLASTEST